MRKNRYKKPGAENRAGTGKVRTAARWILAGLIYGFSLCGLSLGLIALHDLVTQADYYRVDKITISGLERLSRAELLDRAGISVGDNILAVNLFKVKKTLLSHPWVRDVSVSRKIPEELIIMVKEEKALAVVKFFDGETLLMNIQGEPFKIFEEQDDPFRQLPVIAGLDLSKAEEGYGFQGKLYESVMTLMKLKSLKEVRAIRADQDTGLTVHTTDFSPAEEDGSKESIGIRFGFGQYLSKCSQAKEISGLIHTSAPGKRISSMDLFDPGSITVKLINEVNRSDNEKGGV